MNDHDKDCHHQDGFSLKKLKEHDNNTVFFAIFRNIVSLETVVSALEIRDPVTQGQL